MSFIDKSGEPRSDEDLQKAIDAVQQIMVKQPTVLPLFTIHAMAIREFLHELQVYRKMIADAKAKRQGGN